MKRGFTLIEILVTLAIFTAVLAVLVEGLYSGIRAWRSVRLHQVRQAEVRVFTEKLASDFRHLVVLPGKPPIVETTLENGAEKIQIAASMPRKRQRAGLGWVWEQIEYTVDTGEDGASRLRRSVQPYAGARPVGEKPEEEQLLGAVKSLRFDYLGPEGESAVWESQDSLPAAVLVSVTPETGPELVVAAWVPGGSLKRSQVGS